MKRRERIDATGAVILVAWSAVLGLNQVMVKIVNDGFSPVFQAGLRSACAFLPVLLFAMLMKRTLSVKDGSLIPGLIVGVLFATEFLLIFTSLDLTSVSRASVLFYCMPVWVAVGAHFWIPGEQLSPVRVLGLVLAVIGVVVALSHNDAPVTEYALIGDIMALVGSVFWAAIALMMRTTDLSKSSPEMQLLYQLGVSAILLLAVAPLFGALIRDVTPLILGVFATQVLLVVCVGFLVWFWILSIYPASDMASYSFLAPVFGVMLGWAILKEEISWNILVALVLVGIGIVLVNQRGKVNSHAELE